ncbi:MAG: tetratricopeptide repeat protein [Muribaculaceae bacterium]|nr:tetratricopeptide repeat protein [Muribaculaceae bacterium]
MPDFEKIKQLLAQNKLQPAIEMLNAIIEATPESDEAHLLRGHAYRKMEDWKRALSDYATARSINPDNSAADIAYNSTVEVLNFYNTDLYNP